MNAIKERFERFHEQNPHVYERLRIKAFNLKRRGVKRFSIRGLFDVLRYAHAIRTKGDPFLLNDHFTAHYARLVMENNPDLDGFFETRATQA